MFKFALFQTAISYICSNGLLSFLDIVLQLPRIDVNKGDNEGNTPLHFAAEAGELMRLKCYRKNSELLSILFSGRVEIINMLITRCRTLEVNQRNNLGFTPLMKAALQGRTKCAKLLVLGGKFIPFNFNIVSHLINNNTPPIDRGIGSGNRSQTPNASG